MGRRRTFIDTLVKLDIELDDDEIQALWALVGAFGDISVMIPGDGKWLILHIENGRVSGKEWRHG